jgi:hypothetical protein
MIPTVDYFNVEYKLCLTVIKTVGSVLTRCFGRSRCDTAMQNTSRRACDTLWHIIYALNFREKFEAGPDVELLLYLRPDATIIVYWSVPQSGRLGAG